MAHKTPGVALGCAVDAEAGLGVQKGYNFGNEEVDGDQIQAYSALSSHEVLLQSWVKIVASLIPYAFPFQEYGDHQLDCDIWYSCPQEWECSSQEADWQIERTRRSLDRAATE